LTRSGRYLYSYWLRRSAAQGDVPNLTTDVLGVTDPPSTILKRLRIVRIGAFRIY
jgi:hypothetical protein